MPWNQESSVGIVMGCLLYGLVLTPGNEDFSFLHSIKTESGAHPVSYLMGTQASFPGVKVAGM
jgi:hypothetical protein